MSHPRRSPHSISIRLVALIASGAEGQHIALLKAGVDDSLMGLWFRQSCLLPCARRERGAFAATCTATTFFSFGDMEMHPDSLRVRRGESRPAAYCDPIRHRECPVAWGSVLANRRTIDGSRDKVPISECG